MSLFGRYAFAHDLPVHSIRCQVDLTRPSDRAIINEHFFEERRLAQGSEHARKILRRKPHTPATVVREPDKKMVICFGFHFDHIPIHTHHLLRKGFDFHRRLMLNRCLMRTVAMPVSHQLTLMHAAHNLTKSKARAGKNPSSTLNLDRHFELTGNQPSLAAAFL